MDEQVRRQRAAVKEKLLLFRAYEPVRVMSEAGVAPEWGPLHVFDTEGLRATSVHIDDRWGCTVLLVEVEAGVEIPLHTHAERLELKVLRGRAEVTIGTTTHRLGTGEPALLVAAHVPHAVRVEAPSLLLKVFEPPLPEMPPD